MIGIVDYNAGNLKSVANALDRMRKPFRVCASPADLETIRVIILPGVGQFAAASRNLQSNGMFDAIQVWGRDGKPIVGICLGMQLLFESSEEALHEPGLGILAGKVIRLDSPTVPHMGWNRVTFANKTNWITSNNNAYYYFAHGFAVQPQDTNTIVATTKVASHVIPSIIGTQAIRATQFHPEKSGTCGAQILEGMLQW